MNNTARFYLGFVLVLALLIALAYEIGYRAGAAHQHRNDALFFQSVPHHIAPSPPPPSATASATP